MIDCAVKRLEPHSLVVVVDNEQTCILTNNHHLKGVKGVGSILLRETKRGIANVTLSSGVFVFVVKHAHQQLIIKYKIL